MHSILQVIANELDQLANSLASAIPNDEPFSVIHNNWSFPGITRSELIESVRDLQNHIVNEGLDDLGLREGQINDYVRRLQYLRASTVPNIWGNANAGITAFYITLGGLKQLLATLSKSPTDVAADVSKGTARVRVRLSAIEARLNDVEPRSNNLANMVLRIEQAYEAADQLPADLEQLAQDREKIAGFLKAAEEDKGLALAARNEVDEIKKQINASAKEAEAVLEQCHSAYAAATSQGLAAAFAKRSKALDYSMWIWVIGFVTALGFGAYFGSERLHELNELMKNPNLTVGSAALSLLLALLSVGAPIWFCWLATKQIGQRFRLSEDYAFKASVSSAYEGYRREAARFDKEMEARLLSSALSRLDEQPLRFVEQANHGSPWHELATSELVKNAIDTIPGFGEKITLAAKEALGSIRSVTPQVKDSVKVVAGNDATSHPSA